MSETVIEETPEGQTGVVVVALPAATDPVNKIGPEEKHATLLYFGDVGDNPGLTDEFRTLLLQALEVYTKTLGVTAEQVTGVEALGDKGAQVWRLAGDSLPIWRTEIIDTESEIMGVLEQVEQFPEFEPHVTIGYTEGEDELVAPDHLEEAKVIEVITFDRIALWWAGDQTEWNLDSEVDEEVIAVIASAEMDDGPVPWHGVLAVENHRSGDGRGMRNMRRRPLPLPMSWQKTSGPGHEGSVVTQRIDRMVRVGQEIRASGIVLPTPEGDEFLGLVSNFPRFGVSIDADSTEVTMASTDEDTGTSWYDKPRIASASVLPIPAFAEAWMSLGEAPEGFLDGEELEEDVWENEQQEALVAAGFAPETFKRGPGWVTHPEETKRLHDFWTRPGAEGYIRIGWGRGGDFSRCKKLVGEKIAKNSPEDMRYINQICARWHKDAIGVWPGQEAGLEPIGEPASELAQVFNLVESDTLALIASAAGLTAPAEWFEDPQFNTTDGRMVQAIDGTWGAPLQVTPEGQVFGHIAKWGTCHTGMPGKCQTAPNSPSGYAYFLLGQVLTTEGMVATGSLTVGGGHADVRLGMQAAMAHYDNSTSAWSDVTVGEDEYGIWCAGWVRPGTTPEQVVAARASKLSGDWRPVGRSNTFEMMAALCVNSPGFPVPRIHIAAGLQTALVAAGVVEEELPTMEGLSDHLAATLSTTPEFDYDLLAEKVVTAQARREADLRETQALVAAFTEGGQ